MDIFIFGGSLYKYRIIQLYINIETFVLLSWHKDEWGRREKIAQMNRHLLEGFVVMSIHVAGQKIENGHIHQIK